MAERNFELWMIRRRYRMALSLADNAAKYYPDPATLDAWRGDAWRGMAEHPGAAAEEKALLETGKPSDKYLDRFEKKTGEFTSKARPSYEHALRSDNNDTRALRGLGLPAAREGDRTSARSYLTRYLTLADNPPDRRYIVSMLQSFQSEKQ